MKSILNNKKTIIIGFAIILLLVFGYLVIINKDSTKKEKNEPTNDKVELVNFDETVINYVKLNSLPEEYFGYFYKKDKYNMSDIDNNIKIYMAIRKVLSNQDDVNPSKKIEIKEEDVTKELKTIFGNNVTYKHESLNGNNCSYTNFKYDKSKKIYVQEKGECDQSETATIIYENIDRNETDTNLIIKERMAYVQTSYDLENKKVVYHIYKDINKTEKVATVDNYSIASCKDLLNTYQYTFKKENKNYYLEKIEKVN